MKWGREVGVLSCSPYSVPVIVLILSSLYKEKVTLRASFYFEEFIIFAILRSTSFFLLSSCPLSSLSLGFYVLKVSLAPPLTLSSFLGPGCTESPISCFPPVYSETETVITRVEAFWEACRTL